MQFAKNYISVYNIYYMTDRMRPDGQKEKEFEWYLTMESGAEFYDISGPRYTFLKREGEYQTMQYVLYNHSTKQVELIRRQDLEYRASHNVLRFDRQYGLTGDLKKLLDDSSDRIRELLGGTSDTSK